MTSDARPGVATIFLIAGLLQAAPLQAQLFGGDDVARKQIADQQKRTQELQQQNEALAARLAKLEEALKTQPVLDLANQIESLRQEIKNLRGQTEVLGINIENAAKRQRDMYVDLDTRLRRIEQPAATGSQPAPGANSGAAPAAAAASPAAATASAPDGAEARAYETAQNQRRIGNYQGAITAFQAFLAQYPKSTLAPRAQYWIGDSLYNLRDFKGAIANQKKLASTYPDSATVPDALLNMASSQIELGDTASAKKTLDGLVVRYPASEAAEKAKRRLAALK